MEIISNYFEKLGFIKNEYRNNGDKIISFNKNGVRVEIKLNYTVMFKSLDFFRMEENMFLKKTKKILELRNGSFIEFEGDINTNFIQIEDKFLNTNEIVSYTEKEYSIDIFEEIKKLISWNK